MRGAGPIPLPIKKTGESFLWRKKSKATGDQPEFQGNENRKKKSNLDLMEKKRKERKGRLPRFARKTV